METIFQYQGKLLTELQIKSAKPPLEYLFIIMKGKDGRLFYTTSERKPGEEVKISDSVIELDDLNLDDAIGALVTVLNKTVKTNRKKKEVFKNMTNALLETTSSLHNEKIELTE